MNAHFFKRSLATTLLAGAISSALFSHANAEVFGFGAMPPCMNAQALNEIKQLEGLEKSYAKWIAAIQSAIPVEQKQLKDAEAELQKAIQILSGGAANYPAGFSQTETIDKLTKQINELVASIDDDEQREARLNQELTSVQLRLREERMLKACDVPPSNTGYHGGSNGDDGEVIDTNDLLNGPPVTPPVLADPDLPLPEPVIPGFNPSRPLDGLIDPPMKKDPTPIIFGKPQPPEIGMTAPRLTDSEKSRTDRLPTHNDQTVSKTIKPADSSPKTASTGAHSTAAVDHGRTDSQTAPVETAHSHTSPIQTAKKTESVDNSSKTAIGTHSTSTAAVDHGRTDSHTAPVETARLRTSPVQTASMHKTVGNIHATAPVFKGIPKPSFTPRAPVFSKLPAPSMSTPFARFAGFKAPQMTSFHGLPKFMR